MTKAQQVRELILAAKAEGKTADTLIGAVMQQFGFGRQLARTYIKNNWGKVEEPIVLMQDVPSKPEKTLSMSKDAIRKREKRAAAKAAKELAVA